MNDPGLISAYEEHHRNVWPEVHASIRDSGIESLQIFRVENRLFMVMNTRDDFSFEKKASMDNANPHVQRWEELMWKYQQALPGSAPGEKWRLMNLIFDLNSKD